MRSSIQGVSEETFSSETPYQYFAPDEKEK
jgi:hypothetical protein